MFCNLECMTNLHLGRWLLHLELLSDFREPIRKEWLDPTYYSLGGSLSRAWMPRRLFPRSSLVHSRGRNDKCDMRLERRFGTTYLLPNNRRTTQGCISWYQMMLCYQIDCFQTYRPPHSTQPPSQWVAHFGANRVVGHAAYGRRNVTRAILTVRHAKHFLSRVMATVQNQNGWTTRKP